jgi:hypothetical protein
MTRSGLSLAHDLLIVWRWLSTMAAEGAVTYDVLLTRKEHKFIARVRQWPAVVVEGDSA